MERIDGSAIKVLPSTITEERRARLKKAKSMPISFDEDCPETTVEQAVRFRRVVSIQDTTNTLKCDCRFPRGPVK